MSKITDSARDEECTLRLSGVCSYDPATTVWAHSNDIEGGKARGKKLEQFDHIGCYACYACHMTLDGHYKRPAGMTLEYVQDRQAIAVQACAAILKNKGLWPTKPYEKKVRKSKSRKPVCAGRSFLSTQLNGVVN